MNQSHVKIKAHRKECRKEESHRRKNFEERDWHLQSWGIVCDSEESIENNCGEDSLYGEEEIDGDSLLGEVEEHVEIEFDEGSDRMAIQWEQTQWETKKLNMRSTKELHRMEV